MTKIKLTVVAMALTALAALGQTNQLTTLLQQGLFEEQATRNLDAAITDYQTLAAQFDKDRQIAATAVFRLGECYRALGKTNEAAAQYQRILRDFIDQQTLVTLSQQNLNGMEMPLNTAPATAQQQQKDLLAKQITLAEQDLADTQKMVQVGRATPSELRVAEREVLRLKQQLADVDSRRRTDLPALSAQAKPEEDQEIDRIQQMIQNSPDLINAPTPNDATRTLLIKAAFCGWLKVAAYLLDHGADVNRDATDVVQTRDLQAAGKVSPLLAAVAAGNKAMAQFLVDHGADINFQDKNGDTPLHLAAKKGFQAVTDVLLADHADINLTNNSGATPTITAVANNQLKIAQTLLTAGADVNVTDNRGWTALNYAISVSPDIVQTLLESWADPNTVDTSGRTPLSYATEKNNVAIIKLLLAAKADPNAGKLDKPLFCAIQKGDVTTAELLLQAGADPNAPGRVSFSIIPNYYGSSHEGHLPPLWLAVSLNQLPVVQLLLKYKANLNDTQTDGQSLLWLALDQPAIIQTLLDAGADPEAKIQVDLSRFPGNPIPQKYHQSLLQAAANRNLAATVKLLLQHSANPNASEERGNSPLHYAAFNLDDEEIFAALLDAKANPNVRNNDGKTPLDIVKSWQREEMNKPARLANVAAKTELAEKIIALLHQHGALDNLPDWDRITVSRPSANFSKKVFQRGTNDWNHFTLLELLYVAGYNSEPGLTFPDFSQIVVVRPSTNGATAKRIPVNLLGETNDLNCSRDIPLEFGDVVEIPEREHSLAEKPVYLTAPQQAAIESFFHDQSAEAKLVVTDENTVQLPLPRFQSSLGAVLNQEAARAALSSRSDLSRIKIIRHDSAGKTVEWTLDCSKLFGANNTVNWSYDPGLWLRNGDIIEVPEKP